MADPQATWLGRTDDPAAPWPRPFESPAVLESAELWVAMVEAAHRPPGLAVPVRAELSVEYTDRIAAASTYLLEHFG